jgi:glucose/arabinose dehydrogenase
MTHVLRPKRIGYLWCLLMILAVGANGAGAPRMRANASPRDPAMAVASQALELELVPFASGLSQPLSIAHAGDARLFVVEKAGRIRIVRPDGTVDPTPYLDITDRVDDSGGEMGLLGLAFHPNYAGNGYLYVNYTTTADGPRRTRISRFTVDADDSDVADPTSETTLLTVDQPATNHNAGDIRFGPDGFLYVPLGDGGDSSTAQDMGTVLGKILRFDVDMGPGGAADCYGNGSGDYTVPIGNPFIDGAGNDCDETWAAGLRNPWRSSFDRDTGDLYLGDVGQNEWEEIDRQPAGSGGGQNYGWPCYEGNHGYSPTGCGPMSSYTFPIFEYSHGAGHCSVTGGYVYRGSAYPPLVGRYLLADYCSGYMWDLAPTGSGWQATRHTGEASSGLVAFGEDVNGELYVANINQGVIYRLQQWPATYLPVVFRQH